MNLQDLQNEEEENPRMAGGMMRTANGSTIGQSPMNPSAARGGTPTQTPNYATRPGTGNTNFEEINHPNPNTFGQNSLANRAARPVGRSMRNNPERRMEIAERAAVSDNDVNGAAHLAAMRMSGQGAAAGLLSQQRPGFMTPRPTPQAALDQRQSNVALSKANGTFDSIRAKFHKENPGQLMDENGNISKNPNAPPPTTFDPAPDGRGGTKYIPRPQPPAPPAETPPGSDKSSDATQGANDAPQTGGPSSGNPAPQTPVSTGDTPDATKLPAPPRAKGGPVQAGRPYLVGEKGPELVVPAHNGTVVPNHVLKSLFMQSRPVPAAFAQQMARRFRGHRG